MGSDQFRSNPQPRSQQTEGHGRVWSVDAVAKNTSTSFYGSIVTISESPKVPNLIYAGTDDGLIQVTKMVAKIGARSRSSLLGRA